MAFTVAGRKTPSIERNLDHSPFQFHPQCFAFVVGGFARHPQWLMQMHLAEGERFWNLKCVPAAERPFPAHLGRNWYNRGAGDLSERDDSLLHFILWAFRAVGRDRGIIAV